LSLNKLIYNFGVAQSLSSFHNLISPGIDASLGQHKCVYSYDSGYGPIKCKLVILR